MSKFWNALGGRKFFLALIIIGVGTAIEISTERGLSVNMAGLLGTILAVFGASNVVASKDYLKSRGSGGGSSKEVASLGSQVEFLSSQIEEQAAVLENVAQAASNTQQTLQLAMQMGQQQMGGGQQR